MLRPVPFTRLLRQSGPFSPEPGILSLLLLIVSSIGIGGCRAEAPERPPLPRVAQAPPVSADTADTAGEPAPGPGVPPIDQQRRERIDRTARRFLIAIETGDERTFGQMLSTRSRSLIEDVNATREIFSVAQDALGRVRGRSLTLIGGTPDSVALLLRGRRVDIADTTEEELILIMLREQGEWKLMYPGLLRPRSHLLR